MDPRLYMASAMAFGIPHMRAAAGFETGSAWHHGASAWACACLPSGSYQLIPAPILGCEAVAWNVLELPPVPTWGILVNQPRSIELEELITDSSSHF